MRTSTHIHLGRKKVVPKLLKLLEEKGYNFGSRGKGEKGAEVTHHPKRTSEKKKRKNRLASVLRFEGRGKEKRIRLRNRKKKYPTFLANEKKSGNIRELTCC